MPKSHPWPRAVREQRGFTAIEVMVVVAILGLLAALAAPSFTALIERWRVRQAAEDLASTLTFARSEAIRRGGGVVLRRNTPNDTDCPGTTSGAEQWGCGWMVFVDSNGDGVRQAGEELLRISHAPRQLQVKRSDDVSFIRLNRWGEDGLGAYGFGIKPLRDGSGISMAICVSSGGRIDIRQGVSEC
ncbi:GspH/FimT family pseudopilin [Xenophilus sp. Marseille-Q4582]|uniref:GspH/FimT family pseudopilin n=1 Tax=Xenophilus sp. Marseille-Q4582 TaxID=2866600 RepID=UPI00272B6D69|nr:GspH/FimT family pseudopilin [Xenophilus sp. Marseille-Q4582]